MTTYRTKHVSLFVLTGVLLASGCKQHPAATPGSPSATGSPAQAAGVLNSDGSITNPDGSVTYPAESSVARNADGTPAAPAQAPAAPANTPASITQAPAPAPAPLVVPVHTAIAVRLTTGLAASRNEVGDRWTGVLESPLSVRGTEVFRAGTPVSGEVVSSKGKGRFKGAGDLGISLTAIGRDRVETSVYEKNAKGRGKRTAGFIGGGAGLGALIGGLAGGGKGALIGGLAGAGGGLAGGGCAIIVLAQRDPGAERAAEQRLAATAKNVRHVTIPSESVITFRLTQALRR